MKRTILVVIALLAVASVSFRESRVSAQSRDGSVVLAGGPQPLTQTMVAQMIDFFEWALDGKFTQSQIAEFQRGRIAEWRSGRQSDIEASLKIVSLHAQLMALPQEQRNSVKGRAQEELLRTLRQQPDDALGKLLLAVYESGRGSNVINGGVIEGTVTPRAGALPPELIGEWQSNSGSTVNYVNPNTGSYSAPSGDRLHYRFFPDGRYIEAGLMQSSLYNCTMSVSGYKTGVYGVEGQNLTLDEKTFTLTSRDNCHREWNYEKHPAVTKETYRWRLEQGRDGLKLVMTDAKGKNWVYYRVKPGNEILK